MYFPLTPFFLSVSVFIRAMSSISTWTRFPSLQKTLGLNVTNTIYLDLYFSATGFSLVFSMWLSLTYVAQNIKNRLLNECYFLFNSKASFHDTFNYKTGSLSSHKNCQSLLQLSSVFVKKNHRSKQKFAQQDTFLLTSWTKTFCRFYPRENLSFNFGKSKT